MKNKWKGTNHSKSLFFEKNHDTSRLLKRFSVVFDLLYAIATIKFSQRTTATLENKNYLCSTKRIFTIV